MLKIVNCCCREMVWGFDCNLKINPCQCIFFLRDGAKLYFGQWTSAEPPTEYLFPRCWSSTRRATPFLPRCHVKVASHPLFNKHGRNIEMADAKPPRLPSPPIKIYLPRIRRLSEESLSPPPSPFRVESPPQSPPPPSQQAHSRPRRGPWDLDTSSGEIHV